MEQYKAKKCFTLFFEYDTGFWTRPGGRPTTAIIVDILANIANVCNIGLKYAHTNLKNEINDNIKVSTTTSEL